MMNSNTPLNLNLQFPNYSTTMYAVQHDRLSRKITAVLADGAAPFAPENGTLAVVRYKKPDGTCGFYDTDEGGNDAVTWEDNVATIMLAEQALTVAGTVLCQVQFYNGDQQRLSSFTWKIIVEENVCPDDDITSSDYFNILTQQIASILDVVTNMPAPSTILPLPDGTAAIGIRGEFARSDHVHPVPTPTATNILSQLTPASGVNLRNATAITTNGTATISAQFDITTAKSNAETIVSGFPKKPLGDVFAVASYGAGYAPVTFNNNGAMVAGGLGVPTGTWYSVTVTFPI